VRRVTKGTWADKQGVLVGDEFMSVNHRRSREFRPSEFLEEMTKRPLTIRLRRTVQKEGTEGMVVSLRVAGLPTAASDEEISSVEEESSEEAEEEMEDAWRSPDEAAKDAALLAEEVAKDNAKTNWQKAGKMVKGKLKQEAVVAALHDKPSPSRRKSKKRLSTVQLKDMQDEEDRLREIYKQKAKQGTLGGALALDVWNEKPSPEKEKTTVPVLQAMSSSSSTLAPDGSSSHSSPAESSAAKQ